MIAPRDFGLGIGDCGSRIADLGLRNADLIIIVEFRWRITDRGFKMFSIYLKRVPFSFRIKESNSQWQVGST
jgi:hypothetical protein